MWLPFFFAETHDTTRRKLRQSFKTQWSTSFAAIKVDNFSNDFHNNTFVSSIDTTPTASLFSLNMRSSTFYSLLLAALTFGSVLIQATPIPGWFKEYSTPVFALLIETRLELDSGPKSKQFCCLKPPERWKPRWQQPRRWQRRSISWTWRTSKSFNYASASFLSRFFSDGRMRPTGRPFVQLSCLFKHVPRPPQKKTWFRHLWTLPLTHQASIVSYRLSFFSPSIPFHNVSYIVCISQPASLSFFFIVMFSAFKLLKIRFIFLSSATQKEKKTFWTQKAGGTMHSCIHAPLPCHISDTTY